MRRSTGNRRLIDREAARILALEDVSPLDYPKLSGFAWTASLDLDDRAAMAASLREALGRAIETEAWNDYDLAWYGWRESARVMDDTELMSCLLDSLDPAASVPLERLPAGRSVNEA